jgi:hypothetical protein
VCVGCINGARNVIGPATLVRSGPGQKGLSLMSSGIVSPGRPAARLKSKRHSGRQRKLSCTGCGFICYASAGAVISCGLPVCACGLPLTVANPRDLAVIDPDEFEALAGRLSKTSHNAMMREAGFDMMILRDRGHDPAAARLRASRAKRCSSDGCGRFASKASALCSVHSSADMPF